jgi:hypothetical protein
VRLQRSRIQVRERDRRSAGGSCRAGKDGVASRVFGVGEIWEDGMRGEIVANQYGDTNDTSVQCIEYVRLESFLLFGSQMDNTQTMISPARRWTAEEVRKLPPAARDAILLAAALQAEQDYRGNTDLTDFEAFGGEDLHGESSNSEPR